jgi:hypothetical protein
MSHPDIQGYLENQIMSGKHDTDKLTKDDIKCSRIVNSNTNCNSVECKWKHPTYKHSRKITECVDAHNNSDVWEEFYDTSAKSSYFVNQKGLEANWLLPYKRYEHTRVYPTEDSDRDDGYTSGKTTVESNSSFSPKSSKHSAKDGGRIPKRKRHTSKFSKKSKPKKSRKHPNKKSLRRHPKKSRNNI